MLAKITDYAMFAKLRLSMLVVFSAAMGYLYALSGPINWSHFLTLILSGFLVTGASNGFNQIIERDLDKMMDRTANRPLPNERMSVNEGMVLAIVMGLIGVALLTFYINPLSGFLGALALGSYTLLYTPMKRISPFSVFVGAIPGAIPPLLGYVAVKNCIDLDAALLFFIQFLWQFPHFWAIAWVLEEDYKKAGFKMLPSPNGRDKRSAFQTVVYATGLLAASTLTFFFHKINFPSTVVIVLCGLFFSYQAIKLYKHCTVEAAKQLMFGSFIYLPVVQVAMVLGKIN
jgi:protoheme IX farnesyltransferase